MANVPEAELTTVAIVSLAGIPVPTIWASTSAWVRVPAEIVKAVTRGRCAMWRFAFGSGRTNYLPTAAR